MLTSEATGKMKSCNLSAFSISQRVPSLCIVNSKTMTEAEERALELYPPKFIAETWVRKPADVNIPLRRAFVEGWKASQQPDPVDDMAV